MVSSMLFCVISFERVVDHIILEDGLDFFGRGGGSLSDDGLLDELVAKVVGGCVKDAFDCRGVSVQAKVS